MPITLTFPSRISIQIVSNLRSSDSLPRRLNSLYPLVSGDNLASSVLTNSNNPISSFVSTLKTPAALADRYSLINKIRVSMGLKYLILAWVALTGHALAATVVSPNFIVTAPTQDFANKVSVAAEYWRKESSRRWVGVELPNWPAKTTITVSGIAKRTGLTRFNRVGTRLENRRVDVGGKEDEILDIIIPHEMTHLVTADYFKVPVPYWAFEGMATSTEHDEKREKLNATFLKMLRDKNAISLGELLFVTSFPTINNVPTLDGRRYYAESHSLTQYLVSLHGRKHFITFLLDATNGEWDEAFKLHYGFEDLTQMQDAWIKWVLEQENNSVE